MKINFTWAIILYVPTKNIIFAASWAPKCRPQIVCYSIGVG